MNVILKYGWLAVLIAMLGDICIPFVLKPFYTGYSHSLMSVSALGNPNSPVRIPFNIWMLIEGVLFLTSIPAIYNYYISISKKLTIFLVVFIAVFAIGACIFTSFFSVNESKEVVTAASQIHGLTSAIGFMLFLFVPLLLAILSFKSNETPIGVISICSFCFAIIFFVLMVMSDKPEFANTVIVYEGLWERLNLLFMYIPLGVMAISNILKWRNG